MTFFYLYLYFIVVNIVYYHIYPDLNYIFGFKSDYNLKKHKQVKRIYYILSFIPIINMLTMVLYLLEDFVCCFKKRS